MLEKIKAFASKDYKQKTAGERLYETKLSDVETKSLQRYEYARSFCKDKDVLDAACGCGYGSAVLGHKAKSVLGIDASKHAIDFALKFWASDNVTYKQFDLNSDLSSLGSFDVIVSLETVEHLDRAIIQTCEKFRGLLRPGGLLIISHPEKEKNPIEEKGESISDTHYSYKHVTERFKKAIFHLYHLRLSVFWNYIKSKIPKKNHFVSFHEHFNIEGETIKKGLIDIGFRINTEWYQEGRFYYSYHVIVAEKL